MDFKFVETRGDEAIPRISDNSDRTYTLQILLSEVLTAIEFAVAEPEDINLIFFLETRKSLG